MTTDRPLPPPLPFGSLPEALRRRTRAALAAGALQSIETEQRLVQDGGILFLVSAVSSLRRKAERAPSPSPGAAQRRGKPNPFLPPEPELTLGAIGPAHTAVLNKFNVLPDHLLIVTRRFEHQETLLTRSDFAALGRCLAEIDGLGFYNGGVRAGASQTHKHLQLVGLPLSPKLPAVPLEPLLPTGTATGLIARLPTLPFEHAFCRIGADAWQTADAAVGIRDLYLEMLRRCGITPLTGGVSPHQSGPYNLLLRRTWMLLVPRTRERFGPISVNALGFAGSLFVRNGEELDLITEAGPMQVLTGVSGRPNQGTTWREWDQT
jgi:ATP adenylyltransferase